MRGSMSATAATRNLERTPMSNVVQTRRNIGDDNATFARAHHATTAAATRSTIRHAGDDAARAAAALPISTPAPGSALRDQTVWTPRGPQRRRSRQDIDRSTVSQPPRKHSNFPGMHVRPFSAHSCRLPLTSVALSQLQRSNGYNTPRRPWSTARASSRS